MSIMRCDLHTRYQVVAALRWACRAGRSGGMALGGAAGERTADGLDDLDRSVRELDRKLEEDGRERPEGALLRAHPGRAR